MTNSKKMETVLIQAGISTRRVLALGSYVHVDTFEKHEDKLTEMMALAGFGKVLSMGGLHLDGFAGHRVVFKLAA